MEDESSTSVSVAIFLIHKATSLPYYYGFEAQSRGVVNLSPILQNRTLTTFASGSDFLLVEIARIFYNIFC